MWICLNDAFLSIVADIRQPDRLLVRARHQDDIETVFPGAHVTEANGAEYRYRTWLPRGMVAAAVMGRIDQIDYSHFKASVMERERQDAYFDVWCIMRRYQQREALARLSQETARTDAGPGSRYRRAV